MNIEVVKQYIQKDEEIKEVEQKLKDLKSERDKFENEVTDMLIENEIQKISLHGKTVFPKERIFVNPTEEGKTMLLEIIKADETLREIVKEDYNTSSFTAYIKEKLENKEEIPENILNLIKISSKWELGIRKS